MGETVGVDAGFDYSPVEGELVDYPLTSEGSSVDEVLEDIISDPGGHDGVAMTAWLSMAPCRLWVTCYQWNWCPELPGV